MVWRRAALPDEGPPGVVGCAVPAPAGQAYQSGRPSLRDKERPPRVCLAGAGAAPDLELTAANLLEGGVAGVVRPVQRDVQLGEVSDSQPPGSLSHHSHRPLRQLALLQLLCLQLEAVRLTEAPELLTGHVVRGGVRVVKLLLRLAALLGVALAGRTGGAPGTSGRVADCGLLSLRLQSHPPLLRLRQGGVESSAVLAENEVRVRSDWGREVVLLQVTGRVEVGAAVVMIHHHQVPPVHEPPPAANKLLRPRPVSEAEPPPPPPPPPGHLAAPQSSPANQLGLFSPVLRAGTGQTDGSHPARNQLQRPGQLDQSDVVPLLHLRHVPVVDNQLAGLVNGAGAGEDDLLETELSVSGMFGDGALLTSGQPPVRGCTESPAPNSRFSRLKHSIL